MDGRNDAVIGVDVGGTFTDLVCWRATSGLSVAKVPTSRADPSAAINAAVGTMASQWGVKANEIVRFLHGTTVATNAVLERKGARVGLLVTNGFADILEIGRQNRRELYSVILEPQTPIFLAPGQYRKDVLERVSSSGQVVLPLDENGMLDAVQGLVDDGVSAIAICFLFSYLNPAHEHRARELILSNFPDLQISISSDVDPAIREYERLAVTAFDAYIKPTVSKYLNNLDVGLSRAGVSAPLQIMQSRGGLAIAAVAQRRPVRLFMSGPAAGVLGGQAIGDVLGIRDLITVDVGGTSCDVALIKDGVPLIRQESAIGGYPVRVSQVDVNSIGSGGGSIAWLDGAGSLRVGPQSAGSEPGPACYGTGGNEATVTDASIVLGYLDPNYFAGGTLKLQPERSFAAVKEKIATPLGLTVERAALGIHQVINSQMSEAIRFVSIRQGYDPREFALVALGGAGALHATQLATELSITRIIIPRYPGVLSASGLLVAPTEHEASAAFPRSLASLTTEDAQSVFDELDSRCAQFMAEEGAAAESTQRFRYADMCYQGQSYNIEIPFPDARDPIAQLTRDFLKAHERVYGYAPDSPISIVNLRAIHRSLVQTKFAEQDYAPSGGPSLKGQRCVMFQSASGPVDTPVYQRDELELGAEIRGPAIFEQSDTTIIVEPEWSARVENSGNIIITLN